MGRALCALLLGATLTLSPLAAQAAPRAENRSAKLALEVTKALAKEKFTPKKYRRMR